MTTTVHRFILIGALSILCLRASGRKFHSHPYYAAVCITLSSRCNWFYAKYSGPNRPDGCKEATPYKMQSPYCANIVCRWCKKVPSRKYRYPCGAPSVMDLCNIAGGGYYGPFPNVLPTPIPTTSLSPTPTPSRSPVYVSQQRPVPRGPKNYKNCVWTSAPYSDRVVIPLGRVPLGTGWDRIKRGKQLGIIFNRSPSKNISPPGKYGKMCFNVKPPMSGTYYFTGITYAPHHTEHNDAWVESDYGFQLWQKGRMNRYVKPGKWLKAYQNYATKGKAQVLNTIDFNAHRFLIPGVQKGKVFKVCIAGRSKKFEMYQLVLIKCVGRLCKGYITDGLLDMPPSKCI